MAAAGFISDEDMAKMEASQPPGFISDEQMSAMEEQSQTEASPPAPNPKNTDVMSKINSAIAGAAQGVTLGFADEILAALPGIIPGGLDYDEAKTTIRDYFDEMRQQNPKTFMGADVAGGFVIPGGKVAKAGVKGIGKGAKLINAMKQGAKLGAVTGAGHADADSLSELAQGAYKGATTGALVPVAMKGAGKVLKPVGKALNKLSPTRLREYAQTTAPRSVGLRNPQLESMAARQGPEAVEDIGQRIIDEDFVKPFTRTRDLLDKSRQLVRGQGKTIGRIKDDIDKQYGKNEEVSLLFPDPGKITQRLKDELGEDFSLIEKYVRPITDRGKIPSRTVDMAGKVDLNRMTFNEVEALKTALDKAKKLYAGADSPAKEVLRRARGILNAESEDALQNVTDKLGMSKVSQAFQTAKKRFGTGKSLEEGLTKKWTQEISATSPRTPLSMGKIPLAGRALSAIDQNVAGVRTKVADKTANTMDRLTNFITRGNTERLGKYAGVLQQALQRGNENLAATHYVLAQQDPEYQAMLNNLDSDDEMRDNPYKEMSP